LPLFFEDCFRKGEVGGERGFDAAPACLNLAAAESEADGDRMKIQNTINTMPLSINISGLVRRNERIKAMAPVVYVVLCLSSRDLEFRTCVSVRVPKIGVSLSLGLWRTHQTSPTRGRSGQQSLLQ